MNKILKSTARTSEYSPTRTREAKKIVVQNPEVLIALIRKNRRVSREVRRAGLRIGVCRQANQEVYSCRLKEPRFTKRQREIMKLLEWLPLWTTYDLARKLGLDANNHGLLGQIGQDCRRITPYWRSVARLVGSQRMRVYSVEPLGDLAKIREDYRWQSSNLDWVSTSSKTQKVAARLP
jgi:hypothetical protein